MLSLKVDEKKNQIYKAAIAVIIVIVFFLLYYFFLSPKDQVASDQGGDQDTIVEAKKLEIKKINLDIFNNEIFAKLNDYRSLNKNTSPTAGNKNPFISQE